MFSPTATASRPWVTEEERIAKPLRIGSVHRVRIALIAPSMSRSFDGVADHSLKLAAGLRLKGHDVLLLGVNDFHPGAKEIDTSPDGIPILNLSGHRPWAEREPLFARRLNEFQPEGLSVQYYWRGYWPGRNHSRIAAFLHRAGRGIRRHLMYHETWDDIGAQYPQLHWLRQCAVALIIARFHHRLRPHVTATNTWCYVRQLRWIGVRAAYAPIPSSFAVVPRDAAAEAAVWREIQAAGLGEVSRDEAWMAVLFGRVQPEWPAADALPWLRQAWQASGRPHGVIVSLGHTAYGDQGWARVVGAAGPAGWRTAKLGLQSEEIVSRVLALADLGVATTDCRLLDKSSSYAAMAAHGLPVFVNDATRGRPTPALAGTVVTPGDDFAATLAAAHRRPPAADRWPELCESYIRALTR